LSADDGIIQVRLSIGLWSYSYPPWGWKKERMRSMLLGVRRCAFLWRLEKESREPLGETKNTMVEVILTEVVMFMILL
jgi:hypothetical protein